LAEPEAWRGREQPAGSALAVDHQRFGRPPRGSPVADAAGRGRAQGHVSQAVVRFDVAEDRPARAEGFLNVERSARLTGLSLTEKERIIDQFSENDPRLRGRLTLAARKGQGASELEIDGVLEDLIELGVIDEAGNPR